MNAFDEQWLVTLKIEVARRRAAREEERRKDQEAIVACNRIEDPDLRQVLLHLLHKATKHEEQIKINPRRFF
jgi:hypothetical protein